MSAHNCRRHNYYSEANFSPSIKRVRPFVRQPSSYVVAWTNCTMRKWQQKHLKIPQNHDLSFGWGSCPYSIIHSWNYLDWQKDSEMQKIMPLNCCQLLFVCVSCKNGKIQKWSPLSLAISYLSASPNSPPTWAAAACSQTNITPCQKKSNVFLGGSWKASAWRTGNSRSKGNKSI